MHIWFVGIGEPLPFVDKDRLLRYGEVTRHLVRQGHRVTWWTSDFSHSRKEYIGMPNERIAADGINYVLVHSTPYKSNVGIARLFHVSSHARNLERAIAGESPPDIIVSAMPTIEASEVAVNFAKAAGVPVVVDIRDEWPEDYVRWLPAVLRPLGRLALRSKFIQLARVCQRATALLGVSERQLRYGLQYAGRAPGPEDGVVYTGARHVQSDGSCAEAQIERWRGLGITTDKFVCVFSGTMSPSRPLSPIVDAVMRLSRSIPIVLVIAGAGDSEQSYRRQARDHPAVLFTGWLDGDSLGTLLNLSDVVLAPYHPDFGFSLPTKIFDYMAVGRPIVSSCPGEAAALIERHRFGINYTFDRSDEVERALLRLYDAPLLRAQMGATAKRLFDEKFDLDVVVADFAVRIEAIGSRRVSVPPEASRPGKAMV